MNDRVLSGNFHTHTHFFIRPLRPVRRPSPFPKIFDPSPILHPPPCPLLRRRRAPTAEQWSGFPSQTSSSFSSFIPHTSLFFFSGKTTAAMAATVRGGRRRVQVPMKSRGSSLFFFSSRGLHSSSSVSFVFVVFCVSGEAVASSSEYDGEKEVKLRPLWCS